MRGLKEKESQFSHGRTLWWCFITFIVVFTSSMLFAQAQYPGGVSGMQIWLKAGASVKLNDREPLLVDGWENESVALAKGIRFTAAAVDSDGKNRPLYVKGSPKMNFNDALRFNYNHFLATAKGFSSTDDLIVFAVYIADDAKNMERMYYTGFGGVKTSGTSTRHPAIGFSPKNSGGRVFNYMASYDGKGGYVQNSTEIQVTILKRGSRDGFTRFRFSGKLYIMGSDGNAIGGPITKFKTDEGIILGGASRNDGAFGGLLAEFIVFNKEIGLENTQKIEAYLATKYGVTLDNVAYKSSKGTVFWEPAAAGTNYQNNVAGIFRDDRSNSIYVSRSTADGGVLTVSTLGSKFAPNVGVTETKPFPIDDSAIYWGTNKGGKASVSVVAKPTCGYNLILDKIWKFRKTNLGNTTVEVRAGGLDFPFRGTGYNVSMLIAQSEAAAKRNEWIAVIPGIYQDNDLEEHWFKMPINRKELYVTFGAVELKDNCKTCTFSGNSQFNFSKNKWNRGDVIKDLVATNGMKFNVSYLTYSDGVLKPRMQALGYPRVVDGTILTTKFRGDYGSKEDVGIMEVNLKDGAAVTSFILYGIDRQGNDADEVEVIGYCKDQKVLPRISGTASVAESSFTVGNGVITGIRPTGISKKNGVAIIEFANPVNKIIIRHKIISRGMIKGYQDIGIGGFLFNCPKPVNPNPDGVEFTLQAPEEVSSCSDFTYTFKISNFACESRDVSFENVLPKGMSWIPGSVLSDRESIGNSTISFTSENKKLTIDKIKLKPMGVTTVAIRAKFDKGAQPITYENQGVLTYWSISENKKMTINSCDVNTTASCQPTKVKMNYGEEVFSPVVKFSAPDVKCYSANSKVELLANIKNPNSNVDFDNLTMTLKYSNNFILKSVKNNGTEIKGNVNEGLFTLDDLKLGRNGEISFVFELESLDLLALAKSVTGKDYKDVKDIPKDVIAQIPNLTASIELNGESENACVSASLGGIFKELDPEIPFCLTKTCFIPPKAGKVVKKNDEFVLVTTLDRTENDIVSTKDINAILYLESKSKGFVITRLTTNAISNLSNPVAGMMVFDLTENCLKMYNGVRWGCLVQSCPNN